MNFCGLLRWAENVFAESPQDKCTLSQLVDFQYYTLYFGKSNNGYRRYIQHSTGNVHISTLRRTLYGLCLTENGEKQYIKEREEEITRMLQECYYEWIPFDEEGKLVECVESICIALGKYPLNVDGNPAISNNWRDYLLEKRKFKK